MRKFTLAITLLLLTPALARAQTSTSSPHGLGYIYFGPATHQMDFTAGFGGEGYFYKGLGAGLEMGTAGFTSTTNHNSNWIGLGSADLCYHFFTKKSKAAPFVTGGYTLFFGQDVFLSAVSTHGYNLGGGVDYLASKHVGLRFDVRFYGHGGQILRMSFPSGQQFNFVAFRIGLTFR